MRAMIAAALLMLAGAAQAQQPAAAPAPVDYSGADTWICLPGRQDACAVPLPTAELTPAGYGPVTQVPGGGDPPIDCFYVYPTVSRDSGPNSDLTPGQQEEMGAAALQFARFRSVCKTYAPLYRSATLASIGTMLQGKDVTPVIALAYGDVLAAWHYYLQHYNKGRPFVLIGHSQGSIHLKDLLAREIEGKPEAARLVSAILLGWAVDVPEGQAVGGSFRTTPLCTQKGQTGCVISYMSFRAESPPPVNAFLGRASHAGMTAACVNPAKLAGGSAALDSYWFTAQPPQQGEQAATWSATGAPPAPFLHTPGLASGECRHDGTAGWLALAAEPRDGDARTGWIPGDVYLLGQLAPGWGMHLADMSVAQGDLIAIVAEQAEAFGKK